MAGRPYDASGTRASGVQYLSWAAAQLGIGISTAYRLVAVGKLPGALRIGSQWRVSIPRLLAWVHGVAPDTDSRSIRDPPGSRSPMSMACQRQAMETTSEYP